MFPELTVLVYVQSQIVQLLRGHASTSEDEHIRIILAQTEMERAKFFVLSYVRTRHYKVCFWFSHDPKRISIMPKIDKYARYITTNAEVQTRPAAGGRDHASRLYLLRWVSRGVSPLTPRSQLCQYAGSTFI